MKTKQESPLECPPRSRRKGCRRPRERKADERAFLVKFGQKVKAMRESQDKTAGDLAAAIGIAVATQFHREAGRQSGQWEDIYRYAKALGCKPQELLP